MDHLPLPWADSQRTVVEKTNRSDPIFHTKLAFLRAILETKTIENYLILQRVKQHIQGEHKLKFWLKNIPKFQKCTSSKIKRPIFLI